jgi:hypothetical protein
MHFSRKPTHTVDAQSGRPVFAAQTVPHLPIICAQLKLLVVLGSRKGSCRSGLIEPSSRFADLSRSCFFSHSLSLFKNVPGAQVILMQRSPLIL